MIIIKKSKEGLTAAEFEPGKKDGIPVKVEIVIPIVFRIE